MKVKKFEHKTVYLGPVTPTAIYTFEDIVENKTALLNPNGLEGWDLVSVITVGTHNSHGLAFFKREIK